MEWLVQMNFKSIFKVVFIFIYIYRGGLGECSGQEIKFGDLREDNNKC